MKLLLALAVLMVCALHPAVLAALAAVLGAAVAATSGYLIHHQHRYQHRGRTLR